MLEQLLSTFIYMGVMSLFGLGVGYLCIINLILKSKLEDKYVFSVLIRTWVVAFISGLFFGPKMFDYLDVLAIYASIVASIFLYMEHEKLVRSYRIEEEDK